MRISDFFNNYHNGKIAPNEEVPFCALELFEMLSEYVQSIKMHQSTSKENLELRNEIKRLQNRELLLQNKLDYAYQLEKVQRNRAEIAERKLVVDKVFHYSKGDIYDVIK